MSSLIKKIIKKLFQHQDSTSPSKPISKYIRIGENSSVEGMKFEGRNCVEDNIYLTVGNNSVVSGNFIIEKPPGNISIGDRTFIGGGRFISINNIEIGNDVMFSWGCTIMDNNAHSLKWSERKNDVRDWKKGLDEDMLGLYKDWSNVKSAPIKIKDKAWIGFEVVILKGVTIGEGAIVGSKSVVTKDIPDWTIVAGNPAQIIREIPLDER